MIATIQRLTILRFESAALLALLIVGYAERDASWLLFTLLFLVPDLSAIGYLRGSRTGAIGYNLGHTLVFPIAVALGGLLFHAPILVTIAIIWGAHIAFDRAIGYGFKEVGAENAIPLRRNKG